MGRSVKSQKNKEFRYERINFDDDDDDEDLARELGASRKLKGKAAKASGDSRGGRRGMGSGGGGCCTARCVRGTFILIMVATTVGALVSIVLYSSVLSTSDVSSLFRKGGNATEDEVDLMEHPSNYSTSDAPSSSKSAQATAVGDGTEKAEANSTAAAASASGEDSYSSSSSSSSTEPGYSGRP